MDASLVIAIVGLALAAASLSWQAATHVLTGGRVRVKLRVGAMSNGAMVTGPPEGLSPELLADLAAQGYRRPIVAVEVANVGRLPVTVTTWKLTHERGISYAPIGESIGKPLPFRLEAGEAETWAVDLQTVISLAQTTVETLTSRSGSRIHGVVELADGRSRRTQESLDLR